jgi:hypothetical protein
MKYAMLAALLLGLAFAAGPARAQGGAPSSELRGVSGVACDKNESPISSAVVYLKNVRTLTVRTYITGDKGEYHFSGLDPNDDYEIHAEHDDLTSANHTVSSLDSRKEMNVTLKIDKEKKKSEK